MDVGKCWDAKRELNMIKFPFPVGDPIFEPLPYHMWVHTATSECGSSTTDTLLV